MERILWSRLVTGPGVNTAVIRGESTLLFKAGANRFGVLFLLQSQRLFSDWGWLEGLVGIPVPSGRTHHTYPDWVSGCDVTTGVSTLQTHMEVVYVGEHSAIRVMRLGRNTYAGTI